MANKQPLLPSKEELSKQITEQAKRLENKLKLLEEQIQEDGDLPSADQDQLAREAKLGFEALSRLVETYNQSKQQFSKNEQQRLEDIVADQTKRYQKCLSKSINKTHDRRQTIQRSSFRMTSPQTDGGMQNVIAGGQLQMVDTQLRWQQQVQEEERKMLIERQEELNRLNRQVDKVNGLMKDIATEVQKQDEYVDLIVDKIDQTGEQIQDGNRELQEAEVYQKSSLKKYIWITVIIIVILAIVGVAVWLSLRNK